MVNHLKMVATSGYLGVTPVKKIAVLYPYKNESYK